MEITMLKKQNIHLLLISSLIYSSSSIVSMDQFNYPIIHDNELFEYDSCNTNIQFFEDFAPTFDSNDILNASTDRIKGMCTENYDDFFSDDENYTPSSDSIQAISPYSESPNNVYENDYTHNSNFTENSMRVINNNRAKIKTKLLERVQQRLARKNVKTPEQEKNDYKKNKKKKQKLL